jgi:hypothetical protein
MNTLMKKATTNIAAREARDPYEVYADTTAPQDIVGKLLRFSKGDFLVGEEAEEIAPGSVLTANLDGLLTGWIRWWDGKKTDQAMQLVSENLAIPRREDLGETDRNQWELGSDGGPRDPWAFTVYLPLLGADEELFTFSTSSRGGHTAIGKLCRFYARSRKLKPECHPRVALQVDSYNHHEYGRIKFPVFSVCGWEPKQRFNDALEAAGLTAPAAPPLEAPLPPVRDDLSDEIPF